MTQKSLLATCPVCKGSKQDALGHPCTNCGGQTMGSATGLVTRRPDGTPCVHEYTSRDAGRCLTQYTCTHCGHFYDIDSGD